MELLLRVLTDILDQDECVRVLLAALQCHKGDLSRNLSSHLQIVVEAESLGCDLVLFPEMSLAGSVDPAAQPRSHDLVEPPSCAAARSGFW